ncbi:MAG: hypothetical protein ABUK11_05305 [Mariprofundaceae bacterium]
MEATMTLIRRMSLTCEHACFQAGLGIGLIIVLSLPVGRALLESSLINHMLVQIPLLALAGWMIGKSMFASLFLESNRNGIPGLLIALFVMLFWMLPRWLDAALSEPLWEAIKFITIPLLIGLPLGISWPRMSSFSRAVVWTNSISMLVILGWLYVAAPLRVCNNYLVNQQEDFGYMAMALAVVIAAYWVGIAFFGKWDKPESSDVIR